LRDVEYGQPRDYPAVIVNADRERLGQLGLSMSDVGRSLTEVTASSRFVARNFWQDPDTGVTYQVQVELPPAQLTSLEALGELPLADPSRVTANDPAAKPILLGDAVEPRLGTVPGELDHYDLQRMLSLTANLHGTDLGHAASAVEAVMRNAPAPPRGVRVSLVGQVSPMNETLTGLRVGLALAVLVIFLLLVASFQSWRLALVVLSSLPAVLAGVLAALALTGTTLNLESFMGAIMAIGIAVANGILLVTMAESCRRSAGQPDAAGAAGIAGARQRLRPILMTTAAMVAGMIPMALALETGSEATAPLGRAVIGGLIASTAATLLILPLVFGALQQRQGMESISLEPVA